MSFDELVKESDFLIVTAALTPETTGKFDKNVFAKMKKGAIFINISRLVSHIQHVPSPGRKFFLGSEIFLLKMTHVGVILCGESIVTYRMTYFRGPLVKTEDLYDALKSGHLEAAGLDVADPEPLPKGHPMLALKNCSKIFINYSIILIFCDFWTIFSKNFTLFNF